MLINHKKIGKKGFTLIEILVVIGIIAVLASVVLVAVNPARQFKLARDSQRTANVEAILNAVDQNISEHGGNFACPDQPNYAIGMDLSIESGNLNTEADIAKCIVPAYISALPYDPSRTNAHYTSSDDYDTSYTINKDPITGQITISANGELTAVITATR